MNASTPNRFRTVDLAALTPERVALITDMVAGYTGGDTQLVERARQVRDCGYLTNEQLLDTVNTPRAFVPASAFQVTAQATRPVVKDGTYTIVNPKTDAYRTIRLSSDTSWMSSPPPAGTRIAQYLFGPDNETSFKGFAFVSPDGTARVWKSSAVGVDIVAALNWLLVNGAGQEATLGKAYAVRSGRCCFCNRKLTTPASVHFGYGPDCAEKNGLPWDGKARGTNALDLVADVVDKIGFQRVATNGAEIVNPDGTVTSTAVAPRRSYEELFGQD